MQRVMNSYFWTQLPKYFIPNLGDLNNLYILVFIYNTNMDSNYGYCLITKFLNKFRKHFINVWTRVHFLTSYIFLIGFSCSSCPLSQEITFIDFLCLLYSLIVRRTKIPQSIILIFVFLYAHGVRHLNGHDIYFLASSLIILLFDSDNGENHSTPPFCFSLISIL